MEGALPASDRDRQGAVAAAADCQPFRRPPDAVTPPRSAGTWFRPVRPGNDAPATTNQVSRAAARC